MVKAIMRRMNLILAFCLPFLALHLPVPSNSQEIMMPVVRNPFDLNLQQVFDESGNPFIVMDVSIAYRRLVFFKKGDLFESRFRVFVELKDSRGKHLFGDVFEKKVVARSYRETVSSKLQAVLKKRLPARPGVKLVEVTVEVVGTSRKFTRKERLEILSGTGSGVAISPPSFKASSSGGQPPMGVMSIEVIRGEDEAVSTNFKATYAELDQWPRVEYSIVSSKELGADTVIVATKLLDSKGKLILYSKKRLPINESLSQRIAVEFDVSYLPIGFYAISTSVSDKETTSRKQSDGEFAVVFNKALFGRYYSDLLELVSLVASEDELAKFSGAVGAERIDEWWRFWKKKDPTPTTDINEKYDFFIERLVYVMKHFSKVDAGWKTDMGKVYIANGHPDKIVERQGSMLGKYYQYWYYYAKGLVYIFEDAMGNGDYRLLTVRML